MQGLREMNPQLFLFWLCIYSGQWYGAERFQLRLCFCDLKHHMHCSRMFGFSLTVFGRSGKWWSVAWSVALHQLAEEIILRWLTLVFSTSLAPLSVQLGDPTVTITSYCQLAMVSETLGVRAWLFWMLSSTPQPCCRSVMSRRPHQLVRPIFCWRLLNYEPPCYLPLTSGSCLIQKGPKRPD